MSRFRLLVGACAGVLAIGAGAVGAAGLQDAPPQEATPAPDPIGDILRAQPPVPEAAPTGEPAPAAPVVVTPAQPLTESAAAEAKETEGGEEEAATEERAEAPTKLEEPAVPTRRQRRPVVIVEAIDKITAESMRFEVAVGGRPVRFNKTLIFTARACEVSAPDEPVEDSIAYMDVSIQPRGAVRASEPRQIFRGWMFASSPGVSGLQHPIYDAWIVGCKA